MSQTLLNVIKLKKFTKMRPFHPTACFLPPPTLNLKSTVLCVFNLFEICRVEMKRKIEPREHGRWALFRPNWILCNAKLNQNTIFIVSADRAKIDASLIFSFYRCKYRILFSPSTSSGLYPSFLVSHINIKWIKTLVWTETKFLLLFRVLENVHW